MELERIEDLERLVDQLDREGSTGMIRLSVSVDEARELLADAKHTAQGRAAAAGRSVGSGNGSGRKRKG